MEDQQFYEEQEKANIEFMTAGFWVVVFGLAIVAVVVAGIWIFRGLMYLWEIMIW